MEIQAKKESLIQLGNFFRNCVIQYTERTEKPMEIGLQNAEAEMLELINKVHHENGWFNSQSVITAMEAWANSLKAANIDDWLANYSFKGEQESKVGVIMAGNIPFVGLHDTLCVLLTDNELHAKLSSKDNSLMRLTLDVLGQISPEYKNRIKLVHQLKTIDVLIATGTDNSSRYFEYYFKDKKKLIRKNRTSVALLNGEETDEEIVGLSYDIFSHFGLGCRNVTKVYLPNGFDLDRLFNAFYSFKEITSHNKYANNYDYNKAVYLLNKIELIENGFLLLKEDEGIHSPVAVLFYEYYDNHDQVEAILIEKKDELQCIVTNTKLECAVPFGKAQSPELWDYADGIDTIDFLLN